MKGLALFEGSWQKVLIKAVLLLFVLFVVYSLIKKIRWKKGKSETDINNFIENELPNTTPIDNSTPSDPDTISDSEANLLANNMEVYMKGWGTNTSSLMSAVECLNGASLNKVYASFGARNYDGEMLDLYGWFAGDLESNPLTSLIFYSDCVPECDSYWDQCNERVYMRKIWSRSSIITTF
tara:strand:- start:469 stop:1011 length:543 start_codon:yes stop_codon:yes gene_type:complete